MIFSKKHIIILVVIILFLGLLFLLRPFLMRQSMQLYLPEGWSYQKSSLCQVQVPLPPKVAPYIGSNGEYWNFKDNINGEGSLFNNTAIALFKDPNAGAKGYVQGVIVISCAKNNNNDSAKSLVEKYEQYLNFGIQNPSQAPVTLKRVREEHVWGQTASVITFEGGSFNPDQEFYVVATNKGVYLISKIEQTDDTFIKQTIDTIFSHISFE